MTRNFYFFFSKFQLCILTIYYLEFMIFFFAQGEDNQIDVLPFELLYYKKQKKRK